MPEQLLPRDPAIWVDVGFWAVSLVLIGSGAAKIADSGSFVRFLSEFSARRVPMVVGRLFGAGEMLLGIAGLAVGGRLVALAIAVVYGAFAVVIPVAIRRDLPSCGCFGVVSSRPRPVHMVMNLLSAVVAVLGAANGVGAMADGVQGQGMQAITVIAAVLVVSAGVIFVDTR